MGKKIYAEKLYGKFNNVYDLATQNITPLCHFMTSPLHKGDKNENLAPPEKGERAITWRGGLIINLHSGVKNLLLKNINALEFFETKIELLKQCVITGDEISGGIIPVDKFERQWRDETGKIYQFLASEAEIVDRVFAGLAIRLKG